MMWELVYADGQVSEFEDNVVWRAADLLGVSSRDRIDLKHRVAERQSVRPRALRSPRTRRCETPRCGASIIEHNETLMCAAGAR